MASAFISYAHEDREFMTALVDHLQGQEHEIRYDQVVLNIGDSLIQKIAREIADGDFLIAIVSPDSVASDWCQRELSLAATDGINEARVKVLPVKFRGAEMPQLLRDTFWADADAHNVETIARQLVSAMNAHLGGADDAEAALEAQGVEEAAGDPAHEEVAGDALVRDINGVAAQIWAVFDAWSGVWNRGGNVADLDSPQRQLRYGLEVLPARVSSALPLVRQLADSHRGDLFDGEDTRELEREIRQELAAVRTRAAQGLPIRPRWLVVANNGQVPLSGRDAVAYLWTIQRGDEQREILVYISGTVMASDDQGLPDEVASAKATQGRSVLGTIAGLDDPPRAVTVTTVSVSLGAPD